MSVKTTEYITRANALAYVRAAVKEIDSVSSEELENIVEAFADALADGESFMNFIVTDDVSCESESTDVRSYIKTRED